MIYKFEFEFTAMHRFDLINVQEDYLNMNEEELKVLFTKYTKDIYQGDLQISENYAENGHPRIIEDAYEEDIFAPIIYAEFDASYTVVTEGQDYEECLQKAKAEFNRADFGDYSYAYDTEVECNGERIDGTRFSELEADFDRAFNDSLHYDDHDTEKNLEKAEDNIWDYLEKNVIYNDLISNNYRSPSYDIRGYCLSHIEPSEDLRKHYQTRIPNVNLSKAEFFIKCYGNYEAELVADVGGKEYVLPLNSVEERVYADKVDSCKKSVDKAKDKNCPEMV